MERRYSEITLKKRRLRIGIVLLVAVLVIGFMSAGISGTFIKKILAAGANKVLPSIFKYLDCEQEEVEAPFWIKVFAPSIFVYTWQEQPGGWFLEASEQAQTGSVPVQGAVNLPSNESLQIQDEEDLHEPGIYISVSKEKELSILQENLFQQNDNLVDESNPNLFQHIALDTDSSPVNADRGILKQYDLSLYHDMSGLIKDFYIVDSSTTANAELLDIDKLTGYDCTLDKNSEGPQILIYHSHSQEGFADSVEGDVSTTIVGAGDKLTRLLEEEYGYKVLHHTGVYDVPSRDNAYSNALPAIEQVLADNPTIQVVIDLHRDAVAEGTKLVKNIDGKDYARFMFFNGICRSTNGPITYLNNPYLQENLAFSFQAQVVAESYFPGVTRKIYLKAWRYNMHLRPRNMLIELGAQTNTVEEVMNTTEILAFVIDKVLSGQ